MDHLGHTDTDKSIEDTGHYLAHEWAVGKRVVTLSGRTGVVTYALVATRGEDWLLHRLRDSDGRHVAAVALLAELDVLDAEG